MARTATCQLSRDALLHNFARVRAAAPRALAMAVVKANAYGHGALRVCRLLDAADGFAVARIDEAQELREGGIDGPLLILGGCHEPLDLEVAAGLGLHTVVHSEYQVTMLEQARLERPLRVWLKVDSGMHRLGVPPGDAEALWQRLAASPAVLNAPRLLTHLANADVPDDPRNAAQLQLFREATDGLQGERSIANSGGILGLPDSHADWVRPGIMLYGGSPFDGRSGPQDDLQPVMQFDTRLVALSRRTRGDRVGYGGVGVCPADMEVGVAAVGYGDGYPRHARPGTPLLVNGQRAALLGRVSMDTITIDLRDVPGAAVGDPVRLWGEGLPADEVADWSGTIAYELFCGITQRVRRIDF